MFKIYDGRTEFYQWDLDRKLIVADKAVKQVHFCNRTGACSLIRNTYEVNGLYLVDVPNILLQDNWDIRVYGFDANYTKHDTRFNVVPRTRPENYVYTDEEQKVWEQLEERIDQIEENGVSDEQIETAVNKYLEENNIQVDLTDYYTKEETDTAINDAIAGIDIPEVDVDLTNYYTKEEVDEKIADAATGDVDLTNYYTKGETDAAIQAAAPDLSNYAKKSDIPDHSNYALKSDIPDLTDYAKKTDIPDVSGYALKTEIPDTTGFITEEEVEAKGYQTEEQVNALIEASGGGSSGGGGATSGNVFEGMKAAGTEIVDTRVPVGKTVEANATAGFISRYNLQPNTTYYLINDYGWSSFVSLGTSPTNKDISKSSLSFNSGSINYEDTSFNKVFTGFYCGDFNAAEGNYIGFKLTEASDGTEGIVPAPTADDLNKFLCSDGTWQLNSPVLIGTYNEIFNNANLHTITDRYGRYNHIEGKENTLGTSNGNSNHMEGDSNKITGSYTAAAHVEGVGNTVTSSKTHAEGQKNTVGGDCSHAEGYGNTTSNSYAHAEGYGNTVKGNVAHAEGNSTLASSAYQHAQGKYNIEDASNVYADIVGNGNSGSKSNAYTLTWEGNATFAGTITSASGADYAEYFEWADGNPTDEDRVGYIVKLNGNKIEFANAEDDVLGIISGTMTVLGDNAEWHWQGKYLTDEFGRIIYDQKEEYQTVVNDETGEETTILVGTFPTPRINPNYDATKPYINRANRPEWDAVGMMGKLFVRDDGTAQVNDYVVANNGIATVSTGRTNMRVMERVGENIIRVCLK